MAYIFKSFSSLGRWWRKAANGSSGLPLVFTEGEEDIPEQPNFTVRRTRLREDGSVRLEPHIIAYGYLSRDFLAPERRGRGAGTWIVFTENCSFGQGEGLWVRPENLLANPRVVLCPNR